MEESNGRSRRSVLKTSAAGLTGVIGASSSIGSAAADPEKRKTNNNPKARRIDSVSGTGNLSSSGTKEDYEKRIADADLAPDGPGAIGTQNINQDPTRQNLEYLAHVSEDITLEGDVFHYADVEFTITAFEAVDGTGNRLTDSDGNYYYVLEFLATADVTNNLYEMSVSTPVISSSIMESRDPRTAHSVNGDWVTLTEGLTVDGTGYQTEASTWVDHGTFGPETWTPGKSGDYGIMYDGNWEGSQYGIIGFASVKCTAVATWIGHIIESDWGYSATGGWEW